MKDRRAQATIEYIILFSVIIAGIILGIYTYIKPATQQAMDDVGTVLNDVMRF